MLRALGIIGGLNAGGFLLTAAIKSEVGCFFSFVSLSSLFSLFLLLRHHRSLLTCSELVPSVSLQLRLRMGVRLQELLLRAAQLCCGLLACPCSWLTERSCTEIIASKPFSLLFLRTVSKALGRFPD
jgi:hypothetical protein